MVLRTHICSVLIFSLSFFFNNTVFENPKALQENRKSKLYHYIDVIDMGVLLTEKTILG